MPTKKGSLWLNLKNNNNSLAAVSTQGPVMQTELKGEACTELPAHTVVLPSEPALLKELLESYFIQ